VRDTEETALALLEATPAIFRLLFEGVPEEIITADLDRDWSPKRILAHMVDVEDAGFADRFRRIVAEQEPSLDPIDAMATLEAGGYMSRPVSELLDELAASRRKSTAWLRTLSAEDLARKATHPTAGEFTLANLLHYWPGHDMAHIRGVQRMLNSVLRHEAAGLDETWDI
jgi:hypothetical protein